MPDPPAGVKAMLDTPDSAVVSWLPPVHPSGVILKYGVYIRILENGHQLDIKNMQHPPGSLDQLLYTLPGLKKRHTYEFFVTAFTKVGEGQSTAVVGVAPSNKGKVSFNPKPLTLTTLLGLPRWTYLKSYLNHTAIWYNYTPLIYLARPESTIPQIAK